MNNRRLLMLAASVVLSVALAFAVRDVVYQVVVLPLSYVIWQLGVMFGAIPELIRWIALVVIFGLVLAWQLVPDLKPASRRPGARRSARGQVDLLALWLLRSRSSNYFKWQLAHRLGRVSQSLDGLAGRDSVASPPGPGVAEYLAAGLNNSFVDFPTRRHLLARSRTTALDVDPGAVVDYLESQTLVDRGNHAENL